MYECQVKRQMTGIGSIWFEIRLKFCPMVSTCDIMHATCTALVWDGPFVAIDGPSLIESFDFCVSSAFVWDGPSVEGPSLIQSFDFCVSVKLSSTL